MQTTMHKKNDKIKMRLTTIEEKMIGRDTYYMSSAPNRRVPVKEIEDMIQTKNIKTPISPNAQNRYDDMPITNIEIQNQTKS